MPIPFAILVAVLPALRRCAVRPDVDVRPSALGGGPLNAHHRYVVTTPLRRDRNGLEVLDRSACLARLARGGVGRIAFIDDDSTVVILPVNFTLHDDEIVISTGQGGAIHRKAEAGSMAGFEIDETDPNYHGGRSVLVRGALHIVGGEGPTGAPGRPPAWGNRGADILVGLSTDHVTGRRIPPESPRAHPGVI